MQIDKRLTAVLNDLIEINNDRIKGYLKAIDDAGEQDTDLKAIFSRFVDESRKNIYELSRHIVQLGGAPITGTTSVSAKAYRVWTEVKTVFTGTGRLALLQFCAYNEQAAGDAYQAALVSDPLLSSDTRKMLSDQKRFLDLSHDTIERLLNIPGNEI